MEDQDDRDDEKKPVQQNGNIVVNFRLSDERLKAKKQAAKQRRDFIRDRTRSKTVG